MLGLIELGVDQRGAAAVDRRWEGFGLLLREGQRECQVVEGAGFVQRQTAQPDGEQVLDGARAAHGRPVSIQGQAGTSSSAFSSRPSAPRMSVT